MNSHEDNWFRLASLGNQDLTIFCKQPNHAIGTQKSNRLICTLYSQMHTKTHSKVYKNKQKMCNKKI